MKKKIQKKRSKLKHVNKYSYFSAEIVADSISPDGIRLTTFEVTFPQIILGELNTHRVFSRNTASNRAIPAKRLITQALRHPFIPERMPKNQSGMSNRDWLFGAKALLAKQLWKWSAKASAGFATMLMWLGVHKQITNRILAPYLWTTAVISATEWDNFFRLRTASDAQPEIKHLADLMYKAYVKGEKKAVKLKHGEWHMPYIGSKEVSEATRMALSGAFSELIDFSNLKNPESAFEHFTQTAIQLASVGRCARVSYLNHGKGNPLDKDIMLAERLILNRHLSPTEHVATPSGDKDFYGNFRGWKQYRKGIRNESGDEPFRK